MKITRFKSRSELNSINLSEILRIKLENAGFITDVDIASGKIGLHMKSFVIDTGKLGYNARVSRYRPSKKGYVRTNTPTWEQREQFNHIVNDFFDKYHLSGTIKSGAYLVRHYLTGRVNEWECVDYNGEPAEPDCQYNGMGELVTEMMTEKQAIERFKQMENVKVYSIVHEALDVDYRHDFHTSHVKARSKDEALSIFYRIVAERRLRNDTEHRYTQWKEAMLRDVSEFEVLNPNYE